MQPSAPSSLTPLAPPSPLSSAPSAVTAVSSSAEPAAAPSLPAIAPAPPHAWSRGLRDLPREHGFEPLAIEGRLPEGLRGTLYRNGPSRFSALGRRNQHWFDGDGAVSAVRFDGAGQAAGAARLVDSDGRAAERRGDWRYYSVYGTPAPRRWQGLETSLRGRVRNCANTSVMVWQGRLYAMIESSPPVELDREALATLGESRLDGVVVRSFSAHPHYVPARRAAYNFGVRHGRHTLLDLYALPDEGPARLMATLPLPGATMIHDFIATERHLVFFVPPLRLRVLRHLLGLGSFGTNLAWRPELGTEVLVVPIDRPEAARRFTVPAFYQWHFADAFERGEELVVDYVRYPDFASNQWFSAMLDGPVAARLDGRLHRAVIDVARGRLRDDEVASAVCEFPRVARPNGGGRFVYAAAYASAEAAAGLFDCLARFDVEKGESRLVTLGEARYPSEPVLVRRPGVAAGDDGWLLALVYDGRRDRSGIAVVDTRELERGPIAWAWFDHHVPFTFHGNFARA